MTSSILQGDCIERMAELEDGSVDAVVCDPPYSLGFMGRTWDSHGANEDVGFGYYLSGLIDGEGHFRVGAGERRCEFAMKLRDDDRWILDRARAFIGHGRINAEPRRGGSAPQAKLIVDSKDGCAALCALLMRYPLRAKKLRDFLTWAEAVDEWLSMPRGNRWHGPADRARLAELGDRIRSERVYTEIPWSGNAFQDWCRRWATETLRVLKPGGHLLAFGGTRTSHRLICGIEDAGFEIRDTILWLYGSGFPKSLDVSKAIDKAAGAEREAVAVGSDGATRKPRAMAPGGAAREAVQTISSPVTSAAAEREGWGTALKPAHEPIVVARKPLVGTVAANVLEHGVGALNIDACRVATAEDLNGGAYSEGGRGGALPGDTRSGAALGMYEEGRLASGDFEQPAGRWPANVLLSHTEDCVSVGTKVVKPSNGSGNASPASGGISGVFGEGSEDDMSGGYGTETVEEWECAPGCPVAALDAQSGVFTSGDKAAQEGQRIGFKGDTTANCRPFPGDSGGASRFFYCAKTSRSERNAGLEGFEEKATPKLDGGDFLPVQADGGPSNTTQADRRAANHHPTVKPINLMRWLVRLVTPPGGLVLDPFTGSGSTGCAAVLEGFDFIGIEGEPEYVAIAEARIAFWAQHVGREVEDVLGLVGASTRTARRHSEGGQLGLEVT